MTRNSNRVNKDYELKTQYFMGQIIKITCSITDISVRGKTLVKHPEGDRILSRPRSRTHVSGLC